MRRSLMITFILLTMAGCPGEKNPPALQPGAEEMLRREKELRAEAEAHRDRERSRKEMWQALTGLAALCAVLLLIAGTALGSRTRHDAERPE